MKQEELDPTGDLDAGWDDDEPEESGPTSTEPLSGNTRLAKPISVAPASDETDELDDAWDAEEDDSHAIDDQAEDDDDTDTDDTGDTDDGAESRDYPDEAEGALDAGWEDDTEQLDDPVAPALVASSNRRGDASDTAARAKGQAGASRGGQADRVSFKKAHRQLSLKNQEHAKRRKKTRKAERKAQRREQARASRERREEQARLERERNAELRREKEREKKARAKAVATSRGARRKQASASRPAPGGIERSHAKTPPPVRKDGPEGSRAAARKPPKGKKARKRARQAQWLTISLSILGVLIVAVVAWWLSRR